MKRAGRFSLSVVAVTLIAMAAGCGGFSPDNDPADTPDEAAFDLSNPLDVMKACDDSFVKRDPAAYETLLDADFEFFPRPEDAFELPWMTGDSWGRSVELGMIMNLFAPPLAGSIPSAEKITIASELHENRTNAEGRTELTYNIRGTILTGPTEGFNFDTRLKLELVLRGETYKILTMVESRAGYRADSSIERNSLAMIKNLYK